MTNKLVGLALVLLLGGVVGYRAISALMAPDETIVDPIELDTTTYDDRRRANGGRARVDENDRGRSKASPARDRSGDAAPVRQTPERAGTSTDGADDAGKSASGEGGRREGDDDGTRALRPRDDDGPDDDDRDDDDGRDDDEDDRDDEDDDDDGDDGDSSPGRIDEEGE